MAENPKERENLIVLNNVANTLFNEGVKMGLNTNDPKGLPLRNEIGK